MKARALVITSVVWPWLAYIAGVTLVSQCPLHAMCVYRRIFKVVSWSEFPPVTRTIVVQFPDREIKEKKNLSKEKDVDFLKIIWNWYVFITKSFQESKRRIETFKFWKNLLEPFRIPSKYSTNELKTLLCLMNSFLVTGYNCGILSFSRNLEDFISQFPHDRAQLLSKSSEFLW